MAKVVANQRGYFGGILRESGDVFTVPDGAKASWWHPYGGDEPVAKPEPAKRKPKAEPVSAEPFADPPEPVRVENEVNAATGATQPDWVSPSDDI
jgi:hypothetical protein